MHPSAAIEPQPHNKGEQVHALMNESNENMKLGTQ